MKAVCEEWPDLGHYSPISAYEQESDSILIADTWSNSYWTSLETMFNAINTVDPDINMKRGYFLLTWKENLLV